MSSFTSSWQRIVPRVFLTLLVVLILGPLSLADAQVQFGGSHFDETGEVQVSIADSGYTDSHSYRFDFVVTKDARKYTYQLFFNDQDVASTIPSGTLARVTGSQSETSDGIKVVIVDQFEPLFANILSASTYLGNRKVLPIRVVFTDGAPTASLSDIAGYMWDATKNLNGWYQEMSHGLLSFPRQLNDSNQSRVEQVNISFSKTGCNPSGWADAVDEALTNRGIDISSFQHLFYFLPETACGWAGLGNVGCFSTCRSWSNDYGTPNISTADVMAHEAGHNLGLNHARTDSNNSGTTQCEYCDEGSTMGYGGIGYRGFNAHSLEQLGWMAAERVATTSTSRTYTMYPSESDMSAVSPAPPADAIQLLRVPYPGDATRYYLVSYRKRTGPYSSDLSNNFHEKVSIHWGSLANTYTYLITTLGTGQTYTSGSISFTMLSSSSSSAVVQFTNGAPPTATPTPQFTNTPEISPTPAPSPEPTGFPIPTSTPTPVPSPSFAPTSIPTSVPTSNPQPTPGGDPFNPAPPEGTPDSDAIVNISISGLKGTSKGILSNVDGAYRFTLRNGRASIILPAGRYQLAVQVKVKRTKRFVRVGRIKVKGNSLEPQFFRFRG